MGFFQWIKKKLGFDEDDFDDIDLNFSTDAAESLMESLSNASRKRRTINMHDRVQREQYIREYCEMMSAASKDVDAQKKEYQSVTEKLSDLDEIDKLPMTERSQVNLRARKIIQIEDEEAKYVRPSKKITETQYRDIDRRRDEIPGVIEDLKKDEEYQMVVRRDLNLLEGEKSAVAYQRKEERTKAKNAKNLAFVSVFAAVMAAIMLLIVNKAMKIQIDMAFVILAAVFAIALTAVCVMYQNAQAGIASANRKLNKTINLQNTVKIKYVNITNVLDYKYAKYGVLNSYELAYLWEKYSEERKAREHDSDLSIRLEQARGELYQVLKQFRINEPSYWVYCPGVLTNEDEEADIRKSLVVQRQRLKKGIDFEMYNLNAAKNEIQSIVKEYPKYGKEIIAIAMQYE